MLKKSIIISTLAVSGALSTQLHAENSYFGGNISNLK